MIGNTAKHEQFITRTGNHSTKGSAKGFSLLNDGENPVDVLSSEEQRESLVKKYQKLLEVRNASTDKDERKRLALEIQELMKEFTAIRKKRKSENAKDIRNIFMDVCRERLTKAMFKILMDEANNRQREALKEEGEA